MSFAILIMILAVKEHPKAILYLGPYKNPLLFFDGNEPSIVTQIFFSLTIFMSVRQKNTYNLISPNSLKFFCE